MCEVALYNNIANITILDGLPATLILKSRGGPFHCMLTISACHRSQLTFSFVDGMTRTSTACWKSAFFAIFGKTFAVSAVAGYSEGSAIHSERVGIRSF